MLHVPLRGAARPGTFREERWDIFGTDRAMWFFELVGDTVWGATAAMLRQLLGFATGTVRGARPRSGTSTGWPGRR